MTRQLYVFFSFTLSSIVYNLVLGNMVATPLTTAPARVVQGRRFGYKVSSFTMRLTLV